MAQKKALVKRDAKGLWAKGQSGNPGGRPKRPDRERYVRIMREVIDDAKWRAICERAAKDAVDGSHPARRWVADYMIGPPIKQSEISVSHDGQLVGVALDKRFRIMAAMLVAVMEKDNDDQLDDQLDIAKPDIIEGEIIQETT